MVSLALYYNGLSNDNPTTDVFRRYSAFFNKFSFEAQLLLIIFQRVIIITQLCFGCNKRTFKLTLQKLITTTISCK